jgi:cytochrome c-type biogenesis protein CcmE
MINRKILIAVIIGLVAVAFLGYTGFTSSLTYYYEIHEMKGQASSLYYRTIRVSGELAPGVETAVGGPLSFTLRDIEDKDLFLPVIYQGTTIPDTFTEGRHIIVEGKYTSSGVFEASSIITKCSSKYIPEYTEPEN